MDDDKIVLDRKSFEALAVDTRVKILKSLKERRKTLTEIAKEQDMSVSGIKEHLSVLERVGLIEKKDDGHKWKYYELTKKGRGIVGPKELKVMILLSTSILALIASVFLMFGPMAQAPMAEPADVQVERTDAFAEPPMKAAQEAAPAEDAVPMAAEAGGMDDEAENALEISEEPEAQEQDVRIPLAVAAISTLTIIACLGILVRNRVR